MTFHFTSDTSNDREKWTEHPVLVYGPRKSGTTLLINLIDGSPEIFVYPIEIKLNIHADTLFTQRDYKNIYIRNQNYDLRHIPDFDVSCFLSSIKKNFVATGIKETIINDVLIMKSCSPLENFSVKKWGLKEVGGNPERVIKFFRSLFFNGKIVLVFRQPLHIARSAISFKKRKGRKLNFGGIVNQAYEAVFITYQLSHYVTDPEVYAVRYEDIVSEDRESRLLEICNFLGIKPFEMMDRPSIFGKSVVVKTSTKQTQLIFDNKKKWSKGLTFSESVLIMIGYLLAYIKIFWTTKDFFSYKKITRLIQMNSSDFCC